MLNNKTALLRQGGFIIPKITKGLESMTNSNSGIFKGTAGDTIDKLQEELAIVKDKAQYWHDEYDETRRNYLELKKAHERLSKEAVSLKSQLDEEIRMNKLPYGFIEQAAHDIALAALKMEWKKGEIHHQNDSGSMRYYLAAYKYILEQLEADINKD